jgi:hypothetical protein
MDTPPHLNLQDALAVMEEEKTELDKVLELLLDPKNIQHNTELNRNEILAFSVLSTICKAHPELSALKTFLAENLVNRVSKGRAGRKEWVKITSRQLAVAEAAAGMEGQARPGMSKYFRRR